VVLNKKNVFPPDTTRHKVQPMVEAATFEHAQGPAQTTIQNIVGIPCIEGLKVKRN